MHRLHHANRRYACRRYWMDVGEIEDIRGLFDDIVQPGTVNIPLIANYFEPPEWTYIDNIIGTGPSQFAPTYQDGASYFVTGWTATSWGTSGYAYSPYLRDFWTLQYNDTAGLQSLTITGLASSGTGDLGVWLYRPVAVGLASLTLSKAEVAGCKSVTGKVTLSSPAPVEGTIVTVTDTLTAATSPLPVKIPSGATTKSFVIKTVPVSVSEGGTVSATVGTTTLSQPLTVRPIGPTSVTLSPISVAGGQPVTGKATLECKAGPGPVMVDLSSNNPAVASPVAASIVVPQSLQSGSTST